MKPYYADDNTALYLGDSADILPALGQFSLCLTDPPYGVKKQPRDYAGHRDAAVAWDDELPFGLLELAAEHCTTLAVMPGVVNLPRMPLRFSGLEYEWTLAAHVSNGMARGPFGFGNWIPVMVYKSPGVRLYRPNGDCRDTPVRTSDKGGHPTRKPSRAIEWLLELLPDGDVLDPFAGGGSTLLAARSLGRRSVGIEREEKYCELAAKALCG